MVARGFLRHRVTMAKPAPVYKGVSKRTFGQYRRDRGIRKIPLILFSRFESKRWRRSGASLNSATREPFRVLVLRFYLRVPEGEVLELVVLVPGALAAHVDVGEEERKHLLAGPQRLGLEDRRGGHAPVKVLQPHHDVHEDFLRDEAVAHRHLPAPQQRVLHPRAQTSAA
eukprot:8667311-Pyramimonas_sp.AAC.1